MQKKLLDAVMSQTSMSKQTTITVLKSLFAVIIEELADDKKIKLSNFGTFMTVKRAARLGRNLHTGESVDIDPTVTVKLKIGKQLKSDIALLNKGA